MFFYILPFLTHCVVLINTDDKGLALKKRVFQLSYGKTELIVKVRCFLEYVFSKDDERSIPKLEIQNIDVQDSKLKLWFHNPQDQLSVDIQCNFGQLEDEIQLSECRALVQTKPEFKSVEYSINHKFKLSTNTKYSFSSRNIFVKVDENGKDMLKFSLDDLIIEFKDHKRSCDLFAESPIMFLEYDWPKVVHPCKVDHSKDFFDPSPHLNILNQIAEKAGFFWTKNGVLFIIFVLFPLSVIVRAIRYRRQKLMTFSHFMVLPIALVMNAIYLRLRGFKESNYHRLRSYMRI